ncbi:MULTISPECIES: hypothetical protein [unclassified Thalassotalea]|uniref:hypothetical protein n=1 Tax=unclassified Thalassotalea TaxID=2614972 RepID=UPI0010820CAE|nr:MULTISPECIES: hypothetical protein [unclassified Thalassotalea]NMP16789.1 hypothetical protein [Thalassotalea sp. Y01]QBY05551.1 hypothetical protein E2K93_14740 [Thalassotalea sp. HSM 43]
MLAALLVPFILIASGLFCLKHTLALRDKQKLMSYISCNPKAKYWVNRYGTDKVQQVCSNKLLPLAVTVCLLIMLTGFIAMINLMA